MIEVWGKQIGINFHKMNLNTGAESVEIIEDKQDRKENKAVKKLIKIKNPNLLKIAN